MRALLVPVLGFTLSGSDTPADDTDGDATNRDATVDKATRLRSHRCLTRMWTTTAQLTRCRTIRQKSTSPRLLRP